MRFAPQNQFGVADHDFTLPDGRTCANPRRVLADGSGCEVVFTLRRQPDMTDEAFESDASAIRTDLETLKRLLEA